MTVSPSINLSEAQARVDDLKNAYAALRAEVEQAGNNPEELTILERVNAKIEELVAKVTEAEEGFGGGASGGAGGGSSYEDGPATMWSIDVEIQDANGVLLPGAEIKISGDFSDTHVSDADGFTRFRIDGGGSFEVEASFDGVKSGKQTIEEPEPMNGHVHDVMLQIDVESPGINPPETPPGIDPPETPPGTNPPETPPGTNPPGDLPPVDPVPGTWSIRAIVTDHEGGKSVGTEVRLMGPTTMSMATDAGGEAKFDVTEPGRYMVQAFTEFGESEPVIIDESAPEEGAVIDAELQIMGAPEDEFTAPTETEEPTLRKGDEDADGWVEYLQKLLNKHLKEAGEATISVSGSFDSATDTAVRWFQEYDECQVDGIVGNQTWSALREDHVRKEIGTDGRAAGEEYSEEGAEGRWLLESGRMAVYDEGMDAMTFTIASVGTEPLKGFKADILFDGTRTQATIGDPTESSGGQDMHTVMVTRVAERFGKRDGPVKIQAYLPQELGGDLWDNDVEILPGGPNFDANWEILVTVKDQDGNTIENAAVDFNGPAGQSALTDGNGQASHGVTGPSRYQITAELNGQRSETAVVDEPDPQDGDVKEVELVINVTAVMTTWSITAIVRDQDGNPIENAGVEFAGPIGLSGTTDADGTVNHGVQGPGSYRVTASFEGISSASQTVEETEPEEGTIREVELTINLGDGPVAADWSITAIVQDQDGNPIADAGVEFNGPIGFSGMTGSDGSVNHGVQGPGRYELTASFDGKTSKTEIVEETTPEPGETREVTLIIELSDGPIVVDWSITAIVQDHNGNPLENAGVSFDGPVGLSGVTGSDGSVNHGVQGPGRYELTATYGGETSNKEIVEETAPEPGETREVTLVIDTSDCNPTAWSITVLVQDQNGNPLKDADVHFDGPIGLNGKTGSDGTINHGVNGPGRYELSAEFDGKSSGTEVVEEVEPTEGDLHEVTLTIDIGDGPVVEPADWKIDAWVWDLDGNALDGAEVRFEGPDGQNYTTSGGDPATHDVTGPARYVITAEYQGLKARANVVDNPDPEAGELRTVDITIDTSSLRAPWSITAWVRDQDAKDLEGATVTFEGPDAFEGQTNAEGMITHHVEGAARYVVMAELEGKQSRKLVVEETAPDPEEDRSIILTIDQGTEPPEVVDDAAWSIKAIVQDQDGNVIPDATVSFDGPEPLSDTSDSAGVVIHEVTGEARYVIEASIGGKTSPREVIEEITPDEGEVRECVLKIDMAMVDEIPWSITATVKDQDGNALEGAEVEFKGPDGSSGSTDGLGQVTQDVQGPGRYEITATLDGKSSRKQVIEEIEPQEGDTHEVELVIDMGVEPVDVINWVIQANVKDHDGNPVNNAAVTFDGPMRGTDMTDASGRVRHEVQGEGRYEVSAMFSGKEARPQTVDGADPQAGDVKEVELVIDLSDVDPPEPGCDVEWVMDVQVNDQNGDPVPNAAVDFDGPIGMTGMTDSSGRVSHEVMGKGKYSLTATTIDGAHSDTEVIDETAPEQGKVHEVTLVVEVEGAGEEEEDDGNPLLADVEIEISNDIYGAITFVFDDKGRFSGIDLKRVIEKVGLAGGADGLIAGGTLELAGVLEGRMKGNKITLTSALTASGSVMVGLGLASPKAWLGVGVEFGLKLARTIETLTVDLDKSVLENAANLIKQGIPQPPIEVTFDLPQTYTLSAAFKGIAGGGSGSVLEGKISKTLANYPDMLEITISATAGGGIDVDVSGWAGVLEFLRDVAEFTSPVTMAAIDELLEIAEDPEGYVQERREQAEEVLDRVADLPSDVQEHFGDAVDRIRRLF